MSPIKLPAAALAILTLATVAGNAHAESCGMGEIDWYGTERANVSSVQDMLQKGENEKAAWLLQRTWPRMREATPVAGSVPVIVEGVRLMALAAVRADGNVRSDLGWSSWTPAERAHNVAWGVSRLRMIVALNPLDSGTSTDLGEALARSAATRDEGRAILETLEGMNAIATPEGFAALALARGEAGDVAGAELASDECQARAANAVVQCASAHAFVQATETAAR